MTTYGTGANPVKVSRHPTLTANTADTVIMATAGDVEILNRGTTDPLYVTTNGDAPVIGANDTYVVPAGGQLRIPTWQGSGTGPSIKLIAASAVPYSVTAAL